MLNQSDLIAQGYNGPGSSTDYSTFNPFNSASYFHSYCQISNYNDQTQVENCWLGDDVVSLTDIYTQKTEVRNIWYDWVKELVSNYTGESVDLLTLLTLSPWIDRL